ncbi:MAG: DUF1778 domain-containing protein [Actinomycetaceae bacterium]|nr:DUF1778 domain-containing protein [Actinomycetaceae bacterium]
MRPIDLYPKTERISIRVSKEIRALIHEAAKLQGINVSDYIMSVLIPAARRDILETRFAMFPPSDWENLFLDLQEPNSLLAAILNIRVPNWEQDDEDSDDGFENISIYDSLWHSRAT